jgi:glycine/D-amino acid oxidase-like deaminating enzyme
VTCDQVVLATNAWASELPEFRRKIVPLYTYVVLTEPIDDDLWADIGWGRRQGIEDKRNFVHYYRRTADNRILWGGTDGIVYAGRNKIRPHHDRNDKVFAKLESTFRATFPPLSRVRFTHRWGGPVAITSNFVPMFGSLDGGRIHYGLGYNGHGVAPSHTGGRILSDLVLQRDRGYRDLFFVNSKEHSFPPEPLNWLGAELTRRALLRQDRRMDEGKPVGDMDPLILRLTNRLG